MGWSTFNKGFVAFFNKLWNLLNPFSAFPANLSLCSLFDLRISFVTLFLNMLSIEIIAELIALNLFKMRFRFIIIFFTCVVSQEGPDVLTFIVLFGICFLAISVTWIVKFSA